VLFPELFGPANMVRDAKGSSFVDRTDLKLPNFHLVIIGYSEWSDRISYSRPYSMAHCASEQLKSPRDIAAPETWFGDELRPTPYSSGRQFKKHRFWKTKPTPGLPLNNQSAACEERFLESSLTCFRSRRAGHFSRLACREAKTCFAAKEGTGGNQGKERPRSSLLAALSKSKAPPEDSSFGLLRKTPGDGCGSGETPQRETRNQKMEIGKGRRKKRAL